MIPTPTANRLAHLIAVLDRLALSGESKISSAKLADLTGFTAHTIRKDINCLGSPGENGSGYEIEALATFLRKGLNIAQPINTIIVGLGRLGQSLLAYRNFEKQGIKIVAGFDSSLNKIEQLSFPIALHPSYEIEEVAKATKAELGIIAVPSESGQKVADRMVAGGIKGILNFTPTFLKVPGCVNVRNFYVAEELLTLAALVRV